jgi:uncharacterized protein
VSNANIKIVQDAYAAFGRQDIESLLAMLTPDVSWGMVGREQDVPMAGIRQGRAGAAEFFRLLKETQDVTSFEPRKFMAAEDKVFCWGHVTWIMCRSRIVGENDFLHVFTIRDGKICSFRGHQDTGLLAEAYHAVPATKRAANG